MIVPKSHPRHASLMQRHALEKGIKKGIVTITGMIAFGRGEAFDYLLGEKTAIPAKNAIKAATALLLLSKKPVISVNGNVAMTCAKQVIELANELNCEIEANIFYPPQTRRKLIAKHFQKLGKKILGTNPKTVLSGLSSKRALVDKNGIFQADTVIVPIEDGDRTIALKKAKKKVIAIDLNPKSRTSKTADISIVDNIERAIPEILKHAKKLKTRKKHELERIVKNFDNKKNLTQILKIMKKNI